MVAVHLPEPLPPLFFSDQEQELEEHYTIVKHSAGMGKTEKIRVRNSACHRLLMVVMEVIVFMTHGAVSIFVMVVMEGTEQQLWLVVKPEMVAMVDVAITVAMAETEEMPSFHTQLDTAVMVVVDDLPAMVGTEATHTGVTGLRVTEVMVVILRKKRTDTPTGPGATGLIEFWPATPQKDYCPTKRQTRLKTRPTMVLTD